MIEWAFLLDSSGSKLIPILVVSTVLRFGSILISFVHHVFRIANYFLQFPFESNSFAETPLDFVLPPGSVVFISGDPFPRLCEVEISNIDSCREVNEWDGVHQSTSSEAFERH
jgi:hypothetical protein